MPVKISNLRTPIDLSEEELPGLVAERLNVPETEIAGWRILRKSLDARSRHSLKFVYSIVADVTHQSDILKRLNEQSDISDFSPARFDDPEPGVESLEERPVVVGSGPAGLLAGYYLAARGFRPLVIERGQPVKERVAAIRQFDAGGDFDQENNYLFGEGGAGCFSDGKLTCRMSGPDVDWVLERFAECGGKSSLVYEHRPHLGSNRLPMICRNFRRKIEAMGGEYRFGCCLEQIDLRDGRIVGLQTSSGFIHCSQVVLGIGHSARDTYSMLYSLGLPMQPKAFQLGLRIEQSQEIVNRHKYGSEKDLKILGAADYNLVARGQRDLFTFCMCSGGIIIPSISEPEMFCSNGMSNSRHDTPFANSGLVVTLDPSEFGSSHPLAGVELQRKFESAAFHLTGRNYLCPIQPAKGFVNAQSPEPNSRYESSCQRGITPKTLDEFLPPVIVQAIRNGLPVMDHKWRGDFLKDAMLVGPEMRGSSPVRIERDRETRQASGFAGLYPVGEGAGYAGGIISAAVDGLRSAREIVRQFAPLAEPVSSESSSQGTND